MTLIQIFNNYFKKKTLNLFSISDYKFRFENFKFLILLSLIVLFTIIYFSLTNFIEEKNKENIENLNTISKSDDFLKEGTPMIFANNLTGNNLKYEGGHHLSDKTVNGLRIGFSQGGDVLLTHKGSIGLTDVVPESVKLLILSPQVTYYRVDKERVNPTYLKFFFISQYFFRQLEKLGKQSTRAYVGITKQRLLPLIIPSKEVQNQFAEKVQAIEAQKAQAQASLTQAEDLFNSLLQRAFKGELV